MPPIKLTAWPFSFIQVHKCGPLLNYLLTSTSLHCVLWAEDKIWTSVQHNNTELTHVQGASPEKPYSMALDYGGNIEQLEAVIDSSEHCEQEVAYYCRRSRLLNTPGKARPCPYHCAWPCRSITGWQKCSANLKYHGDGCMATRELQLPSCTKQWRERLLEEDGLVITLTPRVYSWKPSIDSYGFSSSPKGNDDDTHPAIVVIMKSVLRAMAIEDRIWAIHKKYGSETFLAEEIAYKKAPRISAHSLKNTEFCLGQKIHREQC